MLDLLIINPRSEDIYGGLGDDLVACEPPLWCRIIAAYIRDRGFSVTIIDAEAENLSPDYVAKAVDDAHPRLVCIAAYGHQPSASTQQMVGAGTIARAIKDVPLSVPIIMVGGHVSAIPGRTLYEETIDYACVGEGPITIEGLLQWLGGSDDPTYDRDKIPGLVYSKTASWGEKFIHINASAPLIDMKHLHGNAWDLLPMNKYRAHNWQVLDDPSKRQPYASIHTTFGCPFRCHFCMINSIFESNNYRMRDPTEVVNEMAMLYSRYGVRTFKIVDEMFVLNERHYTSIAKQLIATGLGKDINIWAYARVDTVKPHTLEMLRQAGFRWLALGIESGSKHVRDGAQKALKNDDIRAVVKVIQQHGINVIGNYIFGLPDDDYDSMQATLNLALDLNTEYANFYAAQAYPGSKLYAEAVEKSWELPESWIGYSQHAFETHPLPTAKLSSKQVLAFRDAAFQTYFENPMYQNMLNYRYGAAAVERIKKMTSFKLKRKLLEPELIA